VPDEAQWLPSAGGKERFRSLLSFLLAWRSSGSGQGPFKGCPRALQVWRKGHLPDEFRLFEWAIRPMRRPGCLFWVW
jgi:hypothetical protein